MIGYYGVIPANIRHDLDLSSACKLLYTEITANMTPEGYCPMDNKKLGSKIGMAERTVSHNLGFLRARGYIETIRHENGRSILLPHSVKEVLQSAITPEITEFVNELLNAWNSAYNSRLVNRNEYAFLMAQRLEQFSRKEIEEAFNSRIKMTLDSGWWTNKERRFQLINFKSLIRDDEQIAKYLSLGTPKYNPKRDAKSPDTDTQELDVTQ